MKKLLKTQRHDTPHWVGDGFPVRPVFGYNDLAHSISPFLLMDYAGPAEFTPTEERRGVGEHPHRGFETVTIVYSGEVEHRDSSGGGGIIRPGDVQWMTAAGGLVHEEFHGKEYAKKGGKFEMVQLWVNLPRKDKMTKPRYQGIPSAKIPIVELPKGAGTARIIAGNFSGKSGPAKTFSPINLWDIRLKKGESAEFQVPEGHTATVFVLEGGEVTVGDDGKISPAEIGVLETSGTSFTLTASKDQDATLLFLGGEPLNEPIVGYGPFVMNSPGEIRQAFQDFESGKMGSLEKIAGSEY